MDWNQPRANEEISSYWAEDTATAKELRELEMSEEDHDKSLQESLLRMRILALAKESTSDTTGSNSLLRLGLGVGRSWSASRRAEGLECKGEEEEIPHLDMDHLQLDGNQLHHLQLSPTGLISIAAADIDQAQDQETQFDEAISGIDLRYVEILRRCLEYNESSGSSSNAIQRAVARILVRILRCVMGDKQLDLISSLWSQYGADKHSCRQSEQRFLSLLRRVNELRSQQTESTSTEGLPYPQILALPTFFYKETPSKSTSKCNPQCDVSSSICTICYNDYEDGDELRALTCLHFYHRQCIDPWLLESRACPVCKHLVAVY